MAVSTITARPRVSGVIMNSFTGSSTITVTNKTTWGFFMIITRGWAMAVSFNGTAAPVISTVFGTIPSYATVSKVNDNTIAVVAQTWEHYIIVGSHNIIAIAG